jgi:hypothetical protein
MDAHPALRITLCFICLFGSGCRLSVPPSSGTEDPGSPELPDVPVSRRTEWHPGVPGGIPDSGGFPVHATVTLGGDAAANRTAIQDATDAAGDEAGPGHTQVVQLPAGIFSMAGTIVLNRNFVVLRGAGPDVSGAGAGTRLVETGVDTDLFFMGGFADYADAYDIPGGIAKGAATFTVAPGHSIQAGDIIIVDKLDDGNVTLQGGFWWKRGPDSGDSGPDSPAGYRSIGQTGEVTAVSGNSVTIAGRLHDAFPASLSPQVFRSNVQRSGFEGIGLENMTITGWGNAFGVYAEFLKNSWVKRVEFDGRPASQGGVGTGARGDDIRVLRSVRFTIEGCYLHHSRVYETNNNAYSISLAKQTSDTLVQDNIVWFKNKNIVLEASGGGNVIAYNYIEDPVIADAGDAARTDWTEMCLDGSHLSHPTLDLFEGNYTAKMGAAETHGNASRQTFFRNYCKGDRLYPMTENAGFASVILNRYMRRMNFVGNVLSTRAGGIYAPDFDAAGYMPYEQVDVPKIWSLGIDGFDGNWQGPRDPVVEQELIRVANFDTIRNMVDQQPSAPLPDSLYLTGRPAFFLGYDWPWVDPLASTAAERVKTLPAQARFVAGTYF